MGTTVTVACKMPHGLNCRLFRTVPRPEPLPGGGVKMVEMAEPIPGRSFQLNGYLIPAKGEEPPPPAHPGAFALTHGVDKEMFEEWLRQNEDLDLVRAGLVFAHEKDNEVKAYTKDNKELKSGLEPIDRSNISRNFKGVSTFSEKDN